MILSIEFRMSSNIGKYYPVIIFSEYGSVISGDIYASATRKSIVNGMIVKHRVARIFNE